MVYDLVVNLLAVIFGLLAGLVGVIVFLSVIIFLLIVIRLIFVRR